MLGGDEKGVLYAGDEVQNTGDVGWVGEGGVEGRWWQQPPVGSKPKSPPHHPVKP